jgi:hypothetical protein
VLQIILFAGTFYSLEYPGIVAQPMKNEWLAENTQTRTIKRCSKNSDSLYDRQHVLKQLARILDSTATSFYNAKYLNKKKKMGVAVKNERPVDFTVYDLTEPSNFEDPLDGCIEFKDTHIYHFALMFLPYSFSHVVILEDGQLKVFKAINCKKGDRLEDLINYLNQKLQGRENKNEIIDRVSNYRKYGRYGAVDSTSVECEELKNDKK